ncbi:cell division protein ZapA [Acinetobacter rudis]|uniref:Cell division protein ZapA n=1 Tax=Acinetobacter rudis TaxID=632955 RepID=A0AAW8J5M6_9GAMM|nr:cell division protein ZapA [Acinetobacter rudis]MDQ8934382.1 cell division protein ZapA [Acinetobacter rudis]MDQ9016718.1 cell division protein ZapA [Acinetobacter rudis]
MSDVVALELRLIEQSFRLSTTVDQQADLERAGQQLNEKFQEFRRKAPNMEHNKLVILVALELMQEVLSLNKTLQQYSHCERLLSSMIEEIDKAV